MNPADDYARMRDAMVRDQLAGRDIADPRVLAAMGRVPREEFVPPAERRDAYADHPIPIGLGQTISQPYIVAFMTQAAAPGSGERCLDVGAGSGYQAAVLSLLAREVHAVEILCPLADAAASRLAALGYANVAVRCGDGYQGLPEHAPFDVIVVAAANNHVPEPLLRQLADGGRLVMPVGGRLFQTLWRYVRAGGSYDREKLLPVQFVPLTGPREPTPGNGAPVR